MGFAEEFARKRKEVENEVENHGKTWCRPDCTFFLEIRYRQLRLMSGMPAERVQTDYDSCHAAQIKE